MTITVSNTANTNTVQFWRLRTNELAYAMSTFVVTTNSNTATGNAAVSGSLQSNAVFTAYISGGTVASPGNVTMTTNVSFTGANVQLGAGANVHITTGNSTNRVLVVNTSDYSIFGTRVLLASDVADANLTSVANTQILIFNTPEGKWKNADQSVLTVGNTINLNGQPGSYYTNASNMSTGTLPSARVSGSYTGITAVGTLTSVDIGNVDTTLARASAGDLSVEGNLIYRAGGTDVPVADGGTGASDAPTARTNLGLGSISIQNANNVTITGGSVTGITDLAVADGGTGASNAASARANLGIVDANTSASGISRFATTAEYRNNTANTALSTDQVWSAAAEVTLTDAATVAWDMSVGINFVVTLGGNRTLGNPSNVKVGQSGFIRVIQDATGSRTLGYSSNNKFGGGTIPTLTTTANAIDILYYTAITSTFIHLSLVKDVK